MDWFWGVGFLVVVLGLVVLGKLILDLLKKVRGDDDLDGTNGIIIDQGGPAFAEGKNPPPGNSGGGGGCFINTAID